MREIVGQHALDAQRRALGGHNHLDVSERHLQYRGVPVQKRLFASSTKTPVRRMLAGAVLALGLALSAPALAQVYFTIKQLLSEQYKTASSVSFTRVTVDPTLGAAIQSRLGRPLAKKEYVVYVAKRGQETVGYAFFDEERGEHELIDFATFFDPQGTIVRTEVMAYREAYGSEIRRETFRQQFLGRSAKSGFKVGQDIHAISGATLSSESMARALQRAAVLLDTAVLNKQP